MKNDPKNPSDIQNDTNFFDIINEPIDLTRSYS